MPHRPDTTAREVTTALVAGRGQDRTFKSLVFLILLWLSLFFGVMVVLTLVISTAVKGAPRFDAELVTNYASLIRADTTGFRAGIFGTVWLMFFTALLAVPLGIAAGLYLEEFTTSTRWWTRLIEVNLQNLAAVPSVVYGLLAVAAMVFFGARESGTVLGGALALALLILPVIIITTRESVRAVPREIRDGSLALGATVWQTTWRQVLPSAVPGIATGTILGLSRAIGEAAPLIMVGLAGSVLFTPDGLHSPLTALPMQIFSLTSQSREELRVAASAGIIVLLFVILGMNAIAITIRNKFQRVW